MASRHTTRHLMQEELAPAPRPRRKKTDSFDSRLPMLGPGELPTPPAPRFPAPSDLITEDEIHTEQIRRAHLAQPLLLSSGAPTEMAVRTRFGGRMGWLLQLRAMAASILRRLKQWLRGHPRARLTLEGQRALASLEQLHRLLRIEFDEGGMDLVAFQVAYGQAYYSVLEASRRHHASSRAKPKPEAPENYQSYFEQFLRQMP